MLRSATGFSFALPPGEVWESSGQLNLAKRMHPVGSKSRGGGWLHPGHGSKPVTLMLAIMGTSVYPHRVCVCVENADSEQEAKNCCSLGLFNKRKCSSLVTFFHLIFFPLCC